MAFYRIYILMAFLVIIKSLGLLKIIKDLTI